MNIAIFGAYTLNNIGDDLFYYFLKSLLNKKYGSKFSLNIISYNIGNKYDDFLNLNNDFYFYTKNFIQVINALKKSDILIIGPGSIFGSELRFFKQNIYVFLLIFLGKIFRKKIILLGVDIVNVESCFLKISSFLSLILVDKIFIRFESNYNGLIKKKYLNKNKLSLINDVVYSSYIKNFLVPSLKQEKNKNTNIVLVLSDLRTLKNYKYIELIFLSILENFINKKINFKILSLNIGLNGNKDLNFIVYLIKKYNLDIGSDKLISYSKWNITNIKLVFQLFNNSKLIISNKLHSNIISSILHVPYISLNYHTKMNELNIDLDYKEEYNINLHSMLSDDLFVKEKIKITDELFNIKEINYDYKKVENIILRNDDFFKKFNI